MALINTLIDEKLNSELIRDMVVAILISERNNQKALATAAEKDPDLWDFDVVTEQSTPAIMSAMTTDENIEPPAQSIVNVWIESLSENGDTTDNRWQYGYDLAINVDILSSRRSKKTATGYDRGDTLTAYELQRVIKLVHHILLAGQYSYLNMRRVVLKRKLTSVNIFQADINDRPAERVLGARFKIMVQTHEYTPQILTAEQPTAQNAAAYNSETLDDTGITIKDDADNTLIILEYDNEL